MTIGGRIMKKKTFFNVYCAAIMLQFIFLLPFFCVTKKLKKFSKVFVKKNRYQDRVISIIPFQNTTQIMNSLTAC